MTGERVYLYDTTLRDGAQTQGVDFSVSDKQAIARQLDTLGIDYIEGGWPGANPTDDAFFAAKPDLVEALANLGNSLQALGRHAEAVEAYRRAIALSPRVSGFHAALGRAYLAADERGHAERSYRKAVELDPRNTAAREALRKLGR